MSPNDAAVGTTGIGWRHPHYAQVLESLPKLRFLEVHSENFFADGGAALATLAQARQHYDISLHGIGLGLGSANGIDPWHLDRLHRLAQRIEPVRISDHACFARGVIHGAEVHAADLLPVPFNPTSLDVLCANVQRVQDRLQRSMLVENLSAYVELPGSSMSEPDFLNALTQRTGCQLIVDVNNIYVNALNSQRIVNGPRSVEHAVQSCKDWLDSISSDCVGEIHLAGHCEMDDIVIDDHGSAVCDAVWRAYVHAVRRFGSVPALIEWDTTLPPLQTLLDEAAQADGIVQSLKQGVTRGSAV